jgi:hypothetical protein
MDFFKGIAEFLSIGWRVGLALCLAALCFWLLHESGLSFFRPTDNAGLWAIGYIGLFGGFVFLITVVESLVLLLAEPLSALGKNISAIAWKRRNDKKAMANVIHLEGLEWETLAWLFYQGKERFRASRRSDCICALESMLIIEAEPKKYDGRDDRFFRVRRCVWDTLKQRMPPSDGPPPKYPPWLKGSGW